jgi:hypothetical protein
VRDVRAMGVMTGLFLIAVLGKEADNKEAITVADQLVRDVAHIAWAFMLLHEIKHAELRSTGKRPASIIDEERICDAFAISILLDGAHPQRLLLSGERSRSVQDRAGLTLPILEILKIGSRGERLNIGEWISIYQHPSL